MEQTLDFLKNIIIAPSNWLVHLFSNAGVWIIFITTITFVLMFRYIITPLVGTKSPSGASDIAKRIKEKEEK